jgi:hypothetical protein
MLSRESSYYSQSSFFEYEEQSEISRKFSTDFSNDNNLTDLLDEALKDRTSLHNNSKYTPSVGNF